jgi:enamine deaminase RidA (YjgF/YER057c/UK114 family)
MSKIERHQSTARMSGVVIHDDTVYMAGATANDKDADVAEQTRQILAKIDERMKIAGTNKSKLLTATIWICDMGDFDAMNSVWDAWIDPANPPCRACVQSPKLARDGLLVEIMAIAAK